jgi:hypothetical protein
VLEGMCLLLAGQMTLSYIGQAILLILKRSFELL